MVLGIVKLEMDAPFTDAQYAERRAEDAIKLAVERWSEFDDAAKPFIDHDVILCERERELDDARRDAISSDEEKDEDENEDDDGVAVRVGGVRVKLSASDRNAVAADVECLM